jgi:hypothetical protein
LNDRKTQLEEIKKFGWAKTNAEEKHPTLFRDEVVAV